MENHSSFARLHDDIVEKHGTFADALRSAGLDPNSKPGRAVRRLVELKRNNPDAVRAWDLWALRGLLTFRKGRNL